MPRNRHRFGVGGHTPPGADLFIPIGDDREVFLPTIVTASFPTLASEEALLSDIICFSRVAKISASLGGTSLVLLIGSIAELAAVAIATKTFGGGGGSS